MRPVTVDDAQLFALLDRHAPWRACALVPSLSAWHAADELPLWQALERALGQTLDPPFFAVPWPGAQGLARAILDGVVDVVGRAVVDVGAGSGLAAAAAARMGASRVLALERDPLAVRAARELARRNGVAIDSACADALAPRSGAAANARADAIGDAAVILAGDVVYGEQQRDAFAAALMGWRAHGREVIVADSGRPFFDPRGLEPLCAFDVDTPVTLDGKAQRTVTVYRAR